MKLFSVSKLLFVVAIFFVFLSNPTNAAYSAADLNDDGCVNGADYVLLKNVFGATSGQGDINHDGVINTEDLAYIMKDFAQCTPGALQDQSPFGIEYGRGYRNIPNSPTSLGSFWKQTGAKWVKMNDVQWGNIEPNAPVGGVHSYNWTMLDHDISKENGLAPNDRPNWDEDFNIMVELRARSPWAQKSFTRPPTFGSPGRPPQDVYLPDYRAWIKAVVERYDNDGTDDAPDLTRAVSVYEIESEGSGDPGNLFYYATPAEYALQLKTAYEAAKEADPNVRIMLNGYNLRDLFADGSSEEQLQAKLASLGYQDSVFNIQPILDGKQWSSEALGLSKGYFDIIENHELGAWYQMGPNVSWLEQELQSQGIDPSSVEIWAGDAMNASALVYLLGLEIHPPFGAPLSVAGVPDNALSKNLQLLSIMGNNSSIYNDLGCVIGIHPATDTVCKPSDAAYQSHITQDRVAYDAWFRRLQAEETVKKYLHGLEAGYTMINMGNLENWPTFTSFPENGFLDVNPSNPYLVGNPRPMFYSYKLMTDKIGELVNVTRLDVGRADVYAYEVVLRSGATVYVAWLHNGINEKPTQVAPTPTYPSTQFTFHIDGAQATVTPIITERGVTTPTPFGLTPTNGNITFTLTETPVFIEVE